MKDLIRLIISDNRIENLQDSQLKLSFKESHYLKNVMRIKNGDSISIINGKGYLWRAIKRNDNFLEIAEINSPILFEEKKKLLLGIAVALPKNGFEDILKMCTEIGIDYFQPLFSEHQIKKISNQQSKMIRWNTIINEAVEQCERLWRPELMNILNIYEWVFSLKQKGHLSVSVTRNQNCINLQDWLKTQKIPKNNNAIVWNVIGPEGGWSKKELRFFEENKIQFIKLSETIMRSPTAAINSSSILNQWRNFDMKSFN